jgi:phosphatidylglycerophosphatase GEP4
MVQSWNLQGIKGFFGSLLTPSLFLPHMVIPNISHLNIQQLQQKGIKFLVFDKDNTLTRPYELEIFPPFKERWAEILGAFGPQNVVIVSNSAGTKDDPGFHMAKKIEESVGVQVFASSEKKPSGGEALLQHFDVPAHQVCVIGDRLMTDVLFGRRIRAFTIWCCEEISTKGDNPFALVLRKCEQTAMSIYLRTGNSLPKH